MGLLGKDSFPREPPRKLEGIQSKYRQKMGMACKNRGIFFRGVVKKFFSVSKLITEISPACFFLMLKL